MLMRSGSAPKKALMKRKVGQRHKKTPLHVERKTKHQDEQPEKHQETKTKTAKRSQGRNFYKQRDDETTRRRPGRQNYQKNNKKKWKMGHGTLSGSQKQQRPNEIHVVVALINSSTPMCPGIRIAGYPKDTKIPKHSHTPTHGKLATHSTGEVLPASAAYACL